MKLPAVLTQRLSILLMTVFLSACNHYDRPLTVAAAPWPTFEFLFLAKELNYLPETQYSLFELSAASSVIQAFQAGKLDVAFLSLDEVLTLVALGIDLKIVAVIDHSTGGDALLVKPEITSLDALKWHSVGYENKAAGALLLNEAFAISELTNQSIQLIEVKQSEVKDVYMQDHIDGLIVREPQKQQLLALGARELLNSNQLKHRITHLMIVRSDVAKRKEQKIAQLLAQFYNARRYYLDNEKQALTTMAVRLQVFPSLLADAFKGTRFIEPKDALMRLSGKPSNIEIQANELSQFMTEKNILGKMPTDFRSNISTRILERVIYE